MISFNVSTRIVEAKNVSKSLSEQSKDIQLKAGVINFNDEDPDSVLEISEHIEDVGEQEPIGFDFRKQ